MSQGFARRVSSSNFLSDFWDTGTAAPRWRFSSTSHRTCLESIGAGGTDPTRPRTSLTGIKDAKRAGGCTRHRLLRPTGAWDGWDARRAYTPHGRGRAPAGPRPASRHRQLRLDGQAWRSTRRCVRLRNHKRRVDRLRGKRNPCARIRCGGRGMSRAASRRSDRTSPSDGPSTQPQHVCRPRRSWRTKPARHRRRRRSVHVVRRSCARIRRHWPPPRLLSIQTRRSPNLSRLSSSARACSSKHADPKASPKRLRFL
mmetsp:Transcript_11498/g.70715  ORF Transcript_11498/g.70715 Transcript_11498/m.70715 type:complete len:256 (+) Transcript_11498:1537-2304(+)